MAGNKKRSSDALDSSADTNTATAISLQDNNLEARVSYINKGLRVVRDLCQLSRKVGRIPDSTVEPAKTWLLQLEHFMRSLETNVEISPALAHRTKIDYGLRLMYKKPEFHFQDTTQERARSLYQRWQDQNWGRGEVVEETSEKDATNDEAAESSSAKRRKSSTSDTSAKRNPLTELVTTTVRLPPANHPIFGKHGVMHGLALQIDPDGKKEWILDSRYPKREARVYGHNDLQVGDWWPMQLIALFHGAHGSGQGGIAGNAENGAYSVVTAGGRYEELDQDKGDVLFYSGSRSHENTDPKQPSPSSNATLALKASQRLGKPVRVLRAAGSRSSKSNAATLRLRPTVGYRYDGLYRVIAMQLKMNTSGGLYEQFKLERLGGQPPLDSFVKSRPTAQEVRDFDRRGKGF
ncbi:hypothetical protein Q7P36_001175 [Cladosporium allicinum]